MKPQKTVFFLVAQPLRPQPPPPSNKIDTKKTLNKICFILDWEQNYKKVLKKLFFSFFSGKAPPPPPLSGQATKKNSFLRLP